ncbi:MAG TPA: cytochrome c [Terriglobales bacterium]|jgi:mono/diheme cytochrome c family protein|nr:cytochrome c [Terriglobales bacterium]
MKANLSRWAFVPIFILLLWFACTRGPQKGPPAASPTSGAELYAAECASCHGVSAKGDGPAAAALKVPPPDLTVLAKRNGGRYTDGQVYQIIEWGGAIASHGSREMPVWGVAFRPLSNENQKQVSDRIQALTDYIGTLQVK